MIAYSVQVWLVSGLIFLPLALFIVLVVAGRAYWRAVEGAVLLTMAGFAPSVLIAAIIHPYAAVACLAGFWWWQWRSAGPPTQDNG